MLSQKISFESLIRLKDKRWKSYRSDCIDVKDIFMGKTKQNIFLWVVITTLALQDIPTSQNSHTYLPLTANPNILSHFPP